MDMEWEDLHDGRRRKKVRARGGGEFCGTGMYAKWVLWREGGGGGYDPSLSCPSLLPCTYDIRKICWIFYLMSTF